MKKFCAIFALILLFYNIQAETHNPVSGSKIPDTTITTTEPASGQETGFVARIGSWYTGHLNYWSVCLLMGLESSFIPFPSEIVVPPAAYAACNPDSPLHTTESNTLNIILVIFFATCGALLGALLNYGLSYFLGRPFVYWFADSKIGHLCMINRTKVEKAENYFIKHGNLSTLIGRLIPVIRQLISIPAGLSKMRILPFIGYTALGAMMWNIILALLGYIAHGRQNLISRYSDELSWFILILAGLTVIYMIIKKISRKRKGMQPKREEA